MLHCIKVRVQSYETRDGGVVTGDGGWLGVYYGTDVILPILFIIISACSMYRVLKNFGQEGATSP